LHLSFLRVSYKVFAFSPPPHFSFSFSEESLVEENKMPPFFSFFFLPVAVSRSPFFFSPQTHDGDKRFPSVGKACPLSFSPQVKGTPVFFPPPSVTTPASFLSVPSKEVKKELRDGLLRLFFFFPPLSLSACFFSPFSPFSFICLRTRIVIENSFFLPLPPPPSPMQVERFFFSPPFSLLPRLPSYDKARFLFPSLYPPTSRGARFLFNPSPFP